MESQMNYKSQKFCEKKIKSGGLHPISRFNLAISSYSNQNSFTFVDRINI